MNPIHRLAHDRALRIHLQWMNGQELSYTNKIKQLESEGRRHTITWHLFNSYRKGIQDARKNLLEQMAYEKNKADLQVICDTAFRNRDPNHLPS